MFPMPALRRKTAGAFVTLICAASAVAMAEPGFAQGAGQGPGQGAGHGSAQESGQESGQQSGQESAQGAHRPGPAPKQAGAVSLTAPAAAPLAAKPAVTPLPGMEPAKAAAAKPVPKSIPKPGPGLNDAGHAATGLQTVKLSLVGLIDRSVIGRDGREIGHVIDVLVDAKGQPAALVVDVGGFMGMGNRRIAIAWERFALAGRKPKDALQLPLSDAQVKAAPAYDGSENVTVVQDSIEPPANKPSRPAAARASLDSSRVNLGEGLSSPSDQAADPLNPD